MTLTTECLAELKHSLQAVARRGERRLATPNATCEGIYREIAERLSNIDRELKINLMAEYVFLLEQQARAAQPMTVALEAIQNESERPTTDAVLIC